jgi:hypothetical protein
VLDDTLRSTRAGVVRGDSVNPETLFGGPLWFEVTLLIALAMGLKVSLRMSAI